MPNRLADATSPVPAAARGQPGRLVAVVRRGLRRGGAARRPGAALRRLRRLPLVPRHGARVVRGPEVAAFLAEHFVQHQGRPRGAPGRRRGLHGGHPGDDRAGRLADDGLRHARRASRSTPAPTSRPSRGTGCRRSARCSRRSRPRGATGASEVVAAGESITAQLAAVRPGGLRAGAARRAELLDAAAAGAGARVRRGARRVRRRAEVPAVDGAGVPAAPARAHRRARGAGHGRRHAARRWPAAGIYDQLGGGFARYAVDRAWVVPHFEKMLYDNALLLRVYLHWWRATGAPLAARVARETADFLLRDLRTPEGGFASALDADTRETPHGPRGSRARPTSGRPSSCGRCSVTTTARGRPALLEVTAAGTFEHGASTLQLLRRPRRPGPLGRSYGGGCSPPAPRARSRAATTRWSRPGTAWRSRRWPRPARCSTSRRTSRRPSAAADLLVARAPGRARPAAAHLARRAWSATRRACSRTTPTWPRGCSRCTP